MEISFMLTGFFLIYCLFYLNFSIAKNYFLIAGSGCLLTSFFFRSHQFKILNIHGNIWVVAAIFFILWYLLCGKNYTEIGGAIVVAITVSLGYALLNFISIDFNTFFNMIPLLILLGVVLVLKVGDTFLIGNITVIICEIINIVFLYKKLEFIAIFTTDFVFCIVFVNLLIIAKMLLKKLRFKHEKTC